MVLDGKKLCTKCGERKLAASEFYPAKSRKDGFEPYCKACHAEKAKRQLASASSSPKVIDPTLVQECISCGETKSHAMFTRAKRRKFGIDSECKACRTARTRDASLARWRANREVRKAALNARRRTPEARAKRNIKRRAPHIRKVELDRN